ncbi:hypothetical protein [Staphylococcus casei]|uniref:Uncharacterized protein n=1 Tax=Staphylococcus casei TaxID=201828 RepID=A0ABZ2WBL2_9STAP
MKIKDKLFITNLKYSAMYAGEEENDVQFIDNLSEFKNLSNDDWSIILQFDVVGLENMKTRDLEKDGITLLTYSELASKELRFDGMQGTQIKNGDNFKQSYGMVIPKNIDTSNINNIYLKILYLPDAFSESEVFANHFDYMLNDSENELVKLTFPLPFMKRGSINE